MPASEIKLASARAQEENFVHPCEFIQRSAFQQEEALRMNRIRATHGIGAAIDVGLTEVTLLGGRRLGWMPTSNTLYNAYRGNFTELSPSDLYDLPENDPDVQPSARALAEKAMYGHELTMKSMGMEKVSGPHVMFFCPFCGTLLLVQINGPSNQFMCTNCRYTNPITEGEVLTVNHDFTEFNKPTTDVEEEFRLQTHGSSGAVEESALAAGGAEGGQLTTVQCQNDVGCDSTKAFFIQVQMRSADEPATTFFKCVKCAHQWRQD